MPLLMGLVGLTALALLVWVVVAALSNGDVSDQADFDEASQPSPTSSAAQPQTGLLKEQEPPAEKQAALAPIAAPTPKVIKKTRRRPKLLKAFEPEVSVVPVEEALTPKQPVPPAEFERLVLAVILNERPPRDTFVILKNGAYYLSEADIVASGLNAGSLPKRTVFDGQSHVEASLLGEVSFDESTGTLKIFVPARVFPKTVVNFGRRRPKELDEPLNDSSLFLNYAFAFHEMRPTFNGELGATINGIFFSSGLSASPERGVVRGLTQAIIDIPKRMQRWTVGDAWARSGVLGGGALVGGLQIARRFELDPYFVRQPLLAYDTEALFASTMDVYVNGDLVRSQSVSPGPLRVENLNAPMGLGQTRLVLRDDFGRQRELAQTHYLSSGVLATGVDDYALTAGFQRFRYGTESFNYGAPVVLGSYRRGLSDTLTAGVRAEAGFSLLSGGASLTARLPVGELSLAASASRHDGKGGWGASGLYTLFSRSFGASAHARLLSPDYATVGQAQRLHSLVDAGATMSVPVGRLMSVSGRAAYVSTLEAGAQVRASVFLSSRLGSRFSVHASAMTTHAESRPTRYEAFISLHATITRRTTASAWHRQDGTNPSSGARISRTLNAGNGLGYQVQARQGTKTSVDGRVEYQNAYGRSYVQMGHNGDRPVWGGGVAGGLVFVGNRVHASRPIDQGFALIRLPGMPNVRGYRNNQEVGRTDGKGDLLVSGLLPYHLNRLSIRSDDLPMDVTLTAVERPAVPRHRAGGVVSFGVRPLRVVRGRVAVRQGTNLVSVAFGDLMIKLDETEMSSPLGHNGEFEFDGAPSGRFPARILHERGVCNFYIELPERRNEEVYVNLGLLECVE